MGEMWGDMGEIRRRYGGDMGEILRRYGGDVAEMARDTSPLHLAATCCALSCTGGKPRTWGKGRARVRVKGEG